MRSVEYDEAAGEKSDGDEDEVNDNVSLKIRELEEEEELEDDKVPLLFCSYCLGIDLNCVLAFDRRIVSEVDITVGGSVNNLVSVFACR